MIGALSHEAGDLGGESMTMLSGDLAAAPSTNRWVSLESRRGASLRYGPVMEPISILGDALGPHPSENIAVWIVMAIATALLLLTRFARR